MRIKPGAVQTGFLLVYTIYPIYLYPTSTASDSSLLPCEGHCSNNRPILSSSFYNTIGSGCLSATRKSLVISKDSQLAAMLGATFSKLGNSPL